MPIGSEEKILEVVDEEKGVVIVTEKQKLQLSWPAALVLHEIGLVPKGLKRKELYDSLNLTEGRVDYAIEVLMKHKLIKKTSDKRYILTTAGRNVWEKL